MLNKAMLIGHLGADPELKYTKSGVAVCNFNVATSERWKDKNGEQQEQTEWHHVVVWKNLAEACNQYLHKGSKVYVEGKLQTRKWQDKNGSDRYTTEIVASYVQFLTPNEEGGGSSGGHGGDQHQNSRGNGGYGGHSGDSGVGEDVPF
jgi:single-strand DNA-binding protein